MPDQKNGNTAMHWIVLSQKYESDMIALASMIMKHKPDINIKDGQDMTVLDYAVRKGYNNFVTLLDNYTAEAAKAPLAPAPAASGTLPPSPSPPSSSSSSSGGGGGGSGGVNDLLVQQVEIMRKMVTIMASEFPASSAIKGDLNILLRQLKRL
eukprot:TRINITY_DN9996_c0_g1_i1.p2 TRINITY_DN9996_c0_g1~~TRINITY_DN9996_c0_g1_i1.p2  ORF type:complete len:153 (-),score=59.55 TRINITY_DN9996_c0_g1_i1:8-466(-)